MTEGKAAVHFTLPLHKDAQRKRVRVRQMWPRAGSDRPERTFQYVRTWPRRARPQMACSGASVSGFRLRFYATVGFIRAALLAALCTQLIWAPPLEAEETIESKGEALSLSDCVDLALRHAFSVRIADEKVLAAGERKGEAVLGFLPEVTSGVSWSGNYYTLNKESEYFKGGSDPELKNWTYNRYWWCSLQEPLLDAGRWIDFLEAREGLDREGVDRKRVARDVVRAVVAAFCDLMKARRSVSVAEADLVRTLDTLEMIKASVDLGKKSRYEILGAEVDVGQARQAVIEMTNKERIAMAELSALLGIPIKGDMQFTEPAPGQTAASGALGALMEQALASRPEIRVQELDERLRDLALDRALWDWAPDLSLSGSYQRYLGLGTLDTREETWGVGLSLSVPLVDTAATAKRVAAARHSLRQSQLELAEKKQQIALEVERAFHNHETAREALDLSEKQVASARENYESARERYALEISSRYELSDAQADLSKAELEQVKAYYDLRLAEAELAYQTGEPIRLK